MVNTLYWKEIVNDLIDKENACLAAHVLSSNIDCLEDILRIVDKDILIKNCLLSYSVAISAQPDLDEVLTQFSLPELVNVYKKLDTKPMQTAAALMWLLEDIDPEFKWASI